MVARVPRASDVRGLGCCAGRWVVARVPGAIPTARASGYCESGYQMRAIPPRTVSITS
jgi:hypothetical protein